tara:strand:+ start:540 stop:689 length:150 start_codon:yes stop_codon:yes gene_type:complete
MQNYFRATNQHIVHPNTLHNQSAAKNTVAKVLLIVLLFTLVVAEQKQAV